MKKYLADLNSNRIIEIWIQFPWTQPVEGAEVIFRIDKCTLTDTKNIDKGSFTNPKSFHSRDVHT